jgi:hypothetical protein
MCWTAGKNMERAFMLTQELLKLQDQTTTSEADQIVALQVPSQLAGGTMKERASNHPLILILPSIALFQARLLLFRL